MRYQVLFLFLIFALSGTAFGQATALVLDTTDIRMENILYNDVAGINLIIRKKPGIESVMLTEPSGAHALRSTEWNPVNGDERRAISGVFINDAYSRYSIVSSSSKPDEQFGSAFHLFIPSVVVYGNPNSPIGTVYRDINISSQINIRTFDQKYADPNRSRFQNNRYTIGDLLGYYMPIPFNVTARDLDGTNFVRTYLKKILRDNKFLDSLNDIQLKEFLTKTFQEKERELQQRR
jgi:hypothetical protein